MKVDILFWLLPIFETSTKKLLNEKWDFLNWFQFQHFFQTIFFFQLTGVPALARSNWRWKPCKA